ncbi:hypothetical protein JTE90_014230 [Oedothorax gibbosus]|uniref:Uncharacterized protein n=1 Tax=Oedothorax gibbosus TaxID=931172 RepID=A0AAV6TRV7_9ARAC|nr:hypothetical protein JTE90_014230 [Oedothorax gibbosus]
MTIAGKVVTVVADNAANMKNAITVHLNLPYQPCIAHTLNLVVEDALKVSDTFKDLLQKCRGIVGHFKSSVTSTSKLKNAQIQLNIQPLSIKQDVPTRWNSTLHMLERLLKIKTPLTVAMADIESPPASLESSEWKVVEECVPLLKPIEAMTTELSGEKFDQIERLPIPQKACFFRPAFQKTAFGIEENSKKAETAVKSEVQRMISKNKSSSAVSTISKKSAAKESSIWDIFDARIELIQSNENPSVSSELLLRQYNEMPHVPRMENPMAFWKKQKIQCQN